MGSVSQMMSLGDDLGGCLGEDALKRDNTLGPPYVSTAKEGCNRGHGLSAAIKIGNPESKFLQSGCKLTCSQ